MDGEIDVVHRAREELGVWLTELRASPMDQMALTHAAAELVANAVEHGGRGDDRQVELNARLGTDGFVLVEVVDHGTWKVLSDDIERGRGLAMAAGLVDHLGVSVHTSGTRALLRHQLVRPVPIEATEQVKTSLLPDTVEVVHTAPQSVSLRGAFGHDDVERVAAEILVATRGGTVPLSLDLTGVTRLSTSARFFCLPTSPLPTGPSEHPPRTSRSSPRRTLSRSAPSRSHASLTTPNQTLAHRC